MTYTAFCDLSEYNGPVDFVKVKSLYKFVYLRASWGLNVDKFFQEYRTGAKAAGVPFGAYHYMDWRYSQSQQLNFFINLMQPDPGTCVPVLDLEMDPTNYGNLAMSATIQDMMPQTRKVIGASRKPLKYILPKARGYSLSPTAVDGNVWNWLTGVEKALRMVPEIYTGYYYFKQWMTPNIAWAKYKLWLAWYTQEQNIKVPPPYTTWDKWQYTGNGNAKPIWMNLSGVGEGKSLDVDWQKSSTPPVPPPIPIPVPAYPAYVTTYTVNVRSEASQTSRNLGVLAKGAQVGVDTQLNGYSHFQPNDLFTVGGWIFTAYLKPI